MIMKRSFIKKLLERLEEVDEEKHISLRLALSSGLSLSKVLMLRYKDVQSKKIEVVISKRENLFITTTTVENYTIPDRIMEDLTKYCKVKAFKDNDYLFSQRNSTNFLRQINKIKKGLELDEGEGVEKINITLIKKTYGHYLHEMARENRAESTIINFLSEFYGIHKNEVLDYIEAEPEVIEISPIGLNFAL